MKVTVLLPLLFFFNFGIFCYGINSNRILNGVSVPLEKYPNIVRISSLYPDLSSGQCTGTLISSRHILTAAHCVTDMKIDGSKIETILLSGIIYPYDENTKMISPQPFSTIYTKGYDDNDSRKDDIAIIEISARLDTAPVLLAKNYEENEKDSGTNFGYGGTGSIPKKDSESLMKINIPISNECRANNEIHHYICAGNSTHRSDHGDSGGPLFITSESQMYQVGLVSSGAYINGTVAVENPETILFTRLSVYCDWIEETTKGEAKCHEIYEDGNGAMSKNILVILLTVFIVKILY